MSGFAAVEEILWTYIERLYEGAADRLESIFMPKEHHYASPDEGLSALPPTALQIRCAY